MQQRKILFLTLSSFSSTGGIEKFNRAFIFALSKWGANHKMETKYSAMYDSGYNENYILSGKFRFYNGQRVAFVLQTVYEALKSDVLIIGHINLAVIGVAVKFLKPRKKVIVICHGIEVFEPLKGLKSKMLKQATHLLAVSAFTKKKLMEVHRVNSLNISVFPNTLDPFFKTPDHFTKPFYLKKRYQLNEDEKVIFTITRLNSNEGYKGYDKIVNILPGLINSGLKFKYILAGKADAEELSRMNELITRLNLQNQVILTGFIPDEELTDHYLLADVFVMPSKGEGFGIVFLEAMACGLQVIAGNKDGSTEPLRNGELGLLINPDNEDEIEQAILKALREVKDEQQKKQLQEQVMNHFGFQQYCKRLETILNLN